MYLPTVLRRRFENRLGNASDSVPLNAKILFRAHEAQNAEPKLYANLIIVNCNSSNIFKC